MLLTVEESVTNMLGYIESFVDALAIFVAYVVEIFGIVVIMIGACKCFYFYFRDMAKKEGPKHNIKIDLGNALALGLEFKMGAEILKTVVVRTTTELIILGAIIVLRAILAVLIHWEVKTEKQENGNADVKEHTLFGIHAKKKAEPKEEVKPSEETNENTEKAE